MEKISAELIDRMSREDTLHTGATRPVIFLGLPVHLAVALAGAAYFIQINVTGLEGIAWAAAFVAPLWLFFTLMVSQDPYGINVAVAWLRTCVFCRDKKLWGGVSLSPLPKNRGKDRS